MQTASHIRTLHVLPELKEGGLERGVVEKVIWLKDHGVNSVVVSAGGIWLDKLKNAGIKHIELPLHRKNPFTIFSCSRRLSKIIADENIQLVCAHSRAPAWAVHLATRSGVKRHDPPLVIEAQALYERFWYSKVMCRGDWVIAVSQAIRDHMISLGCDESRIAVVPRWVAPSEFSAPSNEEVKKIKSEWGIPDDSKLVVGVGRITRLKAWDILIKAIGMLPDPKPCCVIVGSAHKRKRKYLDELVSLAGKLGLSDRVKFVGHRDDMDAVYNAADCVVMPSRIVEAFGRVVIEGILSGTPVISTIGCGVAEFLGEEFGDFLVPMNDEKSLCEKIKMVFENRAAVMEKVRIIRERIGRELTLDKSMWATVRVYKELCPDLDWPEEGRGRVG
ncbi:MAG: glycosyltransferase family 4 protein [bacterium]|nr:glycosyltransferase family 4 protein [bacterium]